MEILMPKEGLHWTGWALVLAWLAIWVVGAVFVAVPAVVLYLLGVI